MKKPMILLVCNECEYQVISDRGAAGVRCGNCERGVYVARPDLGAPWRDGVNMIKLKLLEDRPPLKAGEILEVEEACTHWKDRFGSVEIRNSEWFEIVKEDNSNRLTVDEKMVVDTLSDAWTLYLRLPGDDYSKSFADAINKSFADAINDAKRIIALRVAKRVDPDFWRSS